MPFGFFLFVITKLEKRHTMNLMSLFRMKTKSKMTVLKLSIYLLTLNLDRPDLSYPPVIGSLNAFGPAADFLAPGDRIHQIDGISTVGLTNNHILSILCHGDGPALIEIEYSLPDYSKKNEKCTYPNLYYFIQLLFLYPNRIKH